MSKFVFGRPALLMGATCLALTFPSVGAAAGDAAAADAAPSTNGATGKKVLVLPYQPIYRSVAQRKVATATQLLQKELKEKDGLVVIRGAVANGNASAGPTLDVATAAQKEAEEAEARRDITAAIAARLRVIQGLEKNAGAIEKADAYVLAHHRYARAVMWSGDDKKAKSIIEQAARMLPAFELMASDFSRLYRKWFANAARRVVKEKRGELFVKSGLPGAKIFLDGREMDVAPVLLEKTVPGKHLLTAEVEGVPRFGGIVEVKPGKKAVYTVSFGGSVGGDSVGDVADAIAANAIPSTALKSAISAGKSAGAMFVVAGGLAKDEDHFNVHTFVVDVDKGAIAQLDVVNFDLELLTAEADVFRIVQGIDRAVAKFEGKATSIKTIERRIRSKSTINEVDASPASVDRRGRLKVSKKKKGPRAIFKPLKGGSIIIKDEEE